MRLVIVDGEHITTTNINVLLLTTSTPVNSVKI